MIHIVEACSKMVLMDILSRDRFENLDMCIFDVFPKILFLYIQPGSVFFYRSYAIH